jgi:CBS domain-containing protein
VAIVRDIMTTDVVTICEDATVADAAKMMLDRKVSCLPVLDGAGSLVGILTHSNFAPREKDLPFTQHALLVIQGTLTSWRGLDEAYRQIGKALVRDVMTRPVITVGPDAPASQAARLMTEHRIRRLPVVQGGKLVGILTTHDLLKLVQ